MTLLQIDIMLHYLKQKHDSVQKSFSPLPGKEVIDELVKEGLLKFFFHPGESAIAPLGAYQITAKGKKYLEDLTCITPGVNYSFDIERQTYALAPGTSVSIGESPHKKQAIILAVRCDGGCPPHITYECSWWQSGIRYKSTLEVMEISVDEKNEVPLIIGFR